LATNTVTINNAVLTAVTGAAAANQFDRTPGTDITTATNLAAAINLSTNNALITKRVEACNFAANIVLATCLVNNGVLINGHQFIARNGFAEFARLREPMDWLDMKDNLASNPDLTPQADAFAKYERGELSFDEFKQLCG
jgi:hypothetical protein